MKNTTKAFLALLFLLFLSLQLFFTLQSTHFTYDSYHDYRHVSNILETGTPLFDDDLGSLGKTYTFSPLYHYILAGFALIFGEVLTLQIMPSIFIATTPLLIYFIAFKATSNETTSLLAASLSLATPTLLAVSANSLTVLQLLIPSLLLCTYFFSLLSKGRRYLYYTLATLLFSVLLSPLTLIYIFGLIIYILLIKAQNIRESKREPEVVISSFFFATWFNLLLYRDVLSFHGFAALRNNVPDFALSTLFPSFTLQGLINGVGLAGLILGLISSYLYFVEDKRKLATLLISLIFVPVSFLVFRYLSLNFAYSLIGALLCALSVYSITFFFNYSNKLKIYEAQKLFMFLLLLIIGLSMFYSYFQIANESSKIPPQEDVRAMTYLSNLNGSVVLAPALEGAAIAHYASKKTVLDSNYLMQRNIDRRYQDINKVYTTPFITDLIQITDSYNVDYIFLSKNTQEELNISSLRVDNAQCVSLIYDDLAKIYAVNCSTVTM